MFCFPSRRKGRRGDPPNPPEQPQEFSTPGRYRRPGSGWAGLWSRAGIQGSRENWMDPGIPGKEPGWAQVDGREPGSGWNAGAQREKLNLGNTPSGIQTLGKDSRDEPGVPGRAGNGNVPRNAGMAEEAREFLERLGIGWNGGAQQEKPEVGNAPSGIQTLGKDSGDEPGVPGRAGNGNVPRGGMDQIPLQAGSSRDEEEEPGGFPWNRERDTDTGGDAQSPELPSGADPRESLWEKLRQLGQDMEKWEGKSTAALAAGLARLIMETPTPSYPSEPRIQSTGNQPGADRELDVPIRNDGIFVGMLRASGNAAGSDSDSASAILPASLFQEELPQGLEEEFPEVWARSPLDFGLLAEEERLDGPPVLFQPPRRPQALEKERQMAELLREYLEKGIVVEEASDSDSPLILIRKGSGWRLSLDCRRLNATTPVGPQERLNRDRILAAIPPSSRFFSVLDLSNACLAIPLAASSRPRFAFTFQGRQFQFTRLPPTFHGTNSILHRRVAAVLARLDPGDASGVFHYYDDILITGKRRRQAERRTRLVLQLLQSSGFKANRSKAQLVRRQVSYLGVTLAAAGRGVSQEKMEEIRQDCDAPDSWDPRRIRSILGKFENWKGYIRDYLELALPLQRLVAPGNREWEWEWGLELRLRRLREALEAAPSLLFPDKSRPFVMRLSVHKETAGAELLQEKAGILLPVGYSSHKLAGWNLAPLDTWCVVAALAVEAFQMLTGPAPIVIRDPIGNFLLRGKEFVTSSSGGSQFSEPWTLLVVPKVPELQESQRITIPLAPPLQELPPDIPKANVWFLAVEKGLFPVASVGFAAASLDGRRMDGVSGKGVVAEAELEALREILEKHRSRFPLFLYCGHRGLVPRLKRREREQGWNSVGNTWPRVLRWLREFPGMLRVREVGRAKSGEPLEREQLKELSSNAMVLGCVTRSSWIIWKPSRWEQQEIVAQCHRRHEGLEETLARVEGVEFGNSSQQDVARWVRSCPTCRQNDPNPDPAPQRAEGPWSCLRISLSWTLPGTPEGFRALLLVQDELSGWLDAFPLRQRAQPDVSQALLQEVFGRFGKVESVLVSPGPAWLWDSLNQAPLENFWSRLKRSELPTAAAGVFGAARALGGRWAAMLPLLLAGSRSRWIEEEQLDLLLCVPGLPLESCWEWGRPEAPWGDNELGWLRGRRLRSGFRDTVEAVLPARLVPGIGPGIHQVRDLGVPDPGSEYARDKVGVRWIRDWLLPGSELGGTGSAVGMHWSQAPP